MQGLGELAAGRARQNSTELVHFCARRACKKGFIKIKTLKIQWLEPISCMHHSKTECTPFGHFTTALTLSRYNSG
ncbi:protein of unknown function [Paraburkholderia kururiensis]